MKSTPVYIFSGFLGSGKTTAINGIIKSNILSKKKALLILCESGEQELEFPDDAYSSYTVEHVSKDEELNEERFEALLFNNSPDVVIIEQNGIESTSALLDLLEGSRLSKRVFIKRIINVINAKMLEFLMSLMGSAITEQINMSDMALVNFSNEVNEEKLKAVVSTISKIDSNICIASFSEQDDIIEAAKDGLIIPIGKAGFLPSRLSDRFLAGLMAFIFIYFIITFGKALNINFSAIDTSGLQSFSTVFLSLLMQAFPFLMIGTLISSVIQVFVPEERFVKIFPKNKLLSLITAVFAGFFLPLCDCAVVPVAARLIKKGVPVYSAVTFMLAAPLVNPVVIAATLYAFPQDHSIAFYRVFTGVFIAVAAGVSWLLLPQKQPVMFDEKLALTCSCGYCSTEKELINTGLKTRLIWVLNHSGDEFFNVGRFLIAGALISSLVQVFIPKEWLTQYAGGPLWSVVIMMAAAFLMSICSTSDAFIARSFANSVPMQGIMSFMVIGPMLDFKNILMMSGYFTRRFIVKTSLIVISLAFCILYVITNFLFG